MLYEGNKKNLNLTSFERSKEIKNENQSVGIINQEIIKIRAEINESNPKRRQLIINETKSWFFVKMYKNELPLI